MFFLYLLIPVLVRVGGWVS